ncbi:hypothetical protein D6827_02250 [Candidatus Parcubacteria bacterium]|nr:MAG: hypothetical protein D6827_02250 [Candidatus Parcubacteria bacterium]
MSTIKFSNFEIGRNAITSSASSEDTDFPHQNLFYGSAGLVWRTASQVTSSTITLDLGGGNELSADHAIFSGAKAMIAQSPNDVDIELRASTDNFVTSDVLISSATNLQTSDLVGAEPDEIVLTFTATSVYRYWRIKITSTASIYHTLRKASFGTFFDFGGVGPAIDYNINLLLSNIAFTGSALQQFGTTRGRKPFIANFSYKNISDSLRESWETNFIANAEDIPVYLYQATGEDADLISGKTVLLGRLASAQSNSTFKNINNIAFTFIEDINAV